MLVRSNTSRRIAGTQNDEQNESSVNQRETSFDPEDCEANKTSHTHDKTATDSPGTVSTATEEEQEQSVPESEGIEVYESQLCINSVLDMKCI